jgi:hypothetical protein
MEVHIKNENCNIKIKSKAKIRLRKLGKEFLILLAFYGNMKFLVYVVGIEV